MAFDPLTELNTLPDLLRMTWKVYRNNFKTIFTLSVVVAGIFFLFDTVWAFIYASKPFTFEGLDSIWGILFLLSIGWFWPAIISITERSQQYLEEQNLIDVIANGTAHYGKLFMASFVWFLLIAIPQTIEWLLNSLISIEFINSLITLISNFIVFIIIPSYVQFVVQIVVLRQQRAKKAMKYSFEVVRGQWLRATGFSILILAFYVILGYLLDTTFDSVPVVLRVMNTIVALFLGPILPIFRTLLFLNLEARQGMAPWQQTPQSEQMEKAAEIPV